LIFIGHGIASIVVQETLATFKAIELAKSTTGVIFLGFPEFKEESEWSKFRATFLERFTKHTKPLRALNLADLQSTGINFTILSESSNGPNVQRVPMPSEENNVCKISSDVISGVLIVAHVL